MDERKKEDQPAHPGLWCIRLTEVSPTPPEVLLSPTPIEECLAPPSPERAHVEEIEVAPWSVKNQCTLYPSLTDDPPAPANTFAPPPYVTYAQPPNSAITQYSMVPVAPPKDGSRVTRDGPTTLYQYPVITIQNGPVDVAYSGPTSILKKGRWRER